MNNCEYCGTKLTDNNITNCKNCGAPIKQTVSEEMVFNNDDCFGLPHFHNTNKLLSGIILPHIIDKSKIIIIEPLITYE
jgi:predicted amidophosphoribosyltransferase